LTPYFLDDHRRLDYPHYFCSRYLPSHARITMMALRHFNIETAAVKTHIQNAPSAHLRIQWWRQAIEKCYKGDGSGHPVTELLTPAIKEGKLTKGWFVRVLDARLRDLSTSQPRTIDELENYAEDTSSSLFYLGMESMGIRNLNADHAASHIGKALGLVTLIRALPYHAKKREVYIPTELTAKHDITSEQLFKGEYSASIGEAVYEIASVAHGHIEMARELNESLPEGANLILLPTVRQKKNKKPPEKAKRWDFFWFLVFFFSALQC
jgi:NADH dehydrogenase [ubiquinone] 1 alpha subcomplex assembly factor 6